MGRKKIFTMEEKKAKQYENYKKWKEKEKKTYIINLNHNYNLFEKDSDSDIDDNSISIDTKKINEFRTSQKMD